MAKNPDAARQSADPAPTDQGLEGHETARQPDAGSAAAERVHPVISELMWAVTVAATTGTRVGELLGHARTVRSMFEVLVAKKGVGVRSSDARQLRNAWEHAAEQARAAYSLATGTARALEQAQSDAARIEIGGAWELLDQLETDDEREGSRA